ncbi:hypothetical protein [Tautonia plasticadhaerens]|uniref:Uncharacterized protein n=1 Tax=Tautonia plasticadhaerens TaxID=2527974 RepID=A0A518H386_9BACT|nr:hypothetical protein [Tautonia plasticadhaerens]QDV35306.1 hypothetical protein ElP_32090 [Tautonia plasticadhaerens]
MRKPTLAVIAACVLLGGAVALAQREAVVEGIEGVARPHGAGDYIHAGEYLINPDQVAYIRFSDEGDDLSLSIVFAGGGEPLGLEGDAAKEVASQMRPLVDMPPAADPPANVEPAGSATTPRLR